MTRARARSNETWVAQLQASGSGQQVALGDLREALLRGLRGAFPQADSGLLEDAAQDSLLRILDRLSQFQGRSRFVTWATSIAIRVALTELRRRRWKDVSLDDLLIEHGSLGSRGQSGDGGEPALRSEQRAMVDKMYEVIRQQLTDRQRAVLLAELKGMPQSEIARHLASNRNAIYKLAHDARRRLRSGLEAAGFSGGDVQSAFSIGP